MKCPYCGSPNVERMKEWDMPKMGYHVVHYVGRGREFVLRVGFRGLR